MKRLALILIATGVSVLAIVGVVVKRDTRAHAMTVAPHVASAPTHALPTPEERQAFAEKTERAYLASGMDVHMSATGKSATTIVLKYVLVGRPDAYQFSTNAKLIQNLKNLGFRKAVLTDGYDHSWTIDLT